MANHIRRAERKEEEARHLLREAASLRDLQKRLDAASGCICQEQHRRGHCTELGCPFRNQFGEKGHAA